MWAILSGQAVMKLDPEAFLDCGITTLSIFLAALAESSGNMQETQNRNTAGKGFPKNKAANGGAQYRRVYRVRPAGLLATITAINTSAPPAAWSKVNLSSKINHAPIVVTTGIPFMKTAAWEAGIWVRA